MKLRAHLYHVDCFSHETPRITMKDPFRALLLSYLEQTGFKHDHPVWLDRRLRINRSALPITQNYIAEHPSSAVINEQTDTVGSMSCTLGPQVSEKIYKTSRSPSRRRLAESMRSGPIRRSLTVDSLLNTSNS